MFKEGDTVTLILNYEANPFTEYLKLPYIVYIGRFYINDELLDEPFDKIISNEDKMKNFPAMVIPEDEYFLLGDNRPGSMDARYWKPSTIKKEDIYSKIVEIRKDYYK